VSAQGTVDQFRANKWGYSQANDGPGLCECGKAERSGVWRILPPRCYGARRQVPVPSVHRVALSRHGDKEIHRECKHAHSEHG
jgi:hypothetical protein